MFAPLDSAFEQALSSGVIKNSILHDMEWALHLDKLLRHLHAHPEPSVSALARALKRQYRRVHTDVAALEAVGLVIRTGGNVRVTADTVTAEVKLAA